MPTINNSAASPVRVQQATTADPVSAPGNVDYVFTRANNTLSTTVTVKEERGATDYYYDLWYNSAGEVLRITAYRTTITP